jgi:hypothetical protein
MGTRTRLPLCLLFSLDNLVGLLLLDSMHQSWSYAWCHVLITLGTKRLLAYGNSNVVIEQVNKEWDCVKG